MGSCFRSSDFSPPLDGAYRPKGVGRGHGTGTLSNSLGLFCHLSNGWIELYED